MEVPAGALLSPIGEGAIVRGRKGTNQKGERFELPFANVGENAGAG